MALGADPEATCAMEGSSRPLATDHKRSYSSTKPLASVEKLGAVGFTCNLPRQRWTGRKGGSTPHLKAASVNTRSKRPGRDRGQRARARVTYGSRFPEQPPVLKLRNRSCQARRTRTLNCFRLREFLLLSSPYTCPRPVRPLGRSQRATAPVRPCSLGTPVTQDT